MLAKLEYLNPGGSIKDRIGVADDRGGRASGPAAPGGTIVEPTSGNTGVGLAMVAAARGYRCIFVMADKTVAEKIQLLRALGAEVVVCPTDVEPDDPRSYYSVSRRLAEETPNAYNPNQYANPANPATHYATTGPEIWEQLGEELDHLVVRRGHGRHGHRRRAVPEGAEPRDHDRRRRSRGLDLHRRRPLVPDRGGRRGLLARDVRPRDRRPLGADLGSRRVPVRAPGRSGRGDPDRRIGRHGRAGGAQRRARS